MSGTSDGNKKNEAKKLDMDRKKLTKNRSQSVGSMNLSVTEVKKIIGTVDKKPGKSSKTEVDKYNTKTCSDNTNTNIQGGSSSNSSVGYQGVNDITDPNDIFKPRNYVIRSPPITNNDGKLSNNKENDDKLITENPYKRARMDVSPLSESNNQRICDGSCHHIEHPKEQAGEFSNSGLNEEIVLQTLAVLDTLNELSGKQICTSEDQLYIKEAHNSLQKIFSMIIFKMGKLEKGNIELKYKIEKLTQDQMSSSDMKVIKEKHAKKTYADTVGTLENRTDHNIKLPDRKENLPWNTPPPTTKKLETIIRINDISDPKKAMNHLKTQINAKETGSFKAVKQTKTGVIIIESHNKHQQEKLKLAIKDKENIKVTEPQKTNPMFMVTGIEKGFSNEEFLAEIERLNYEIVEELGFSIIDKLQVVTKRQCRNQSKENWIVQAPPEIAKWFLKKGQINFDLVRVYVQEHFNLAMCFKCCGFGHVSKYCNQKETCHKCGAEHTNKECFVDEYKCTNCHKLKLTETNHSARDFNCPVYKRRLERYKANVSYDFLDNINQ